MHSIAVLGQAPQVMALPETNRVWVISYHLDDPSAPAQATFGGFAAEKVIDVYSARAVLYSRRK